MADEDSDSTEKTVCAFSPSSCHRLEPQTHNHNLDEKKDVRYSAEVQCSQKEGMLPVHSASVLTPRNNRRGWKLRREKIRSAKRRWTRRERR
jgi:hypothetical protein